MDIQTVLNGKEYKYYDEFRRWLNNLKQGFINQKDYKGFPTLPENSLDGLDIYIKADTDERKLIFHLLLIEFIEALQHWKADKDMLWTEEGRKRHKEFLEKLEPLLPYMKKEWDKFYW